MLLSVGCVVNSVLVDKELAEFTHKRQAIRVRTAKRFECVRRNSPSAPHRFAHNISFAVAHNIAPAVGGLYGSAEFAASCVRRVKAFWALYHAAEAKVIVPDDVPCRDVETA